jgi:hypothetical protein
MIYRHDTDEASRAIADALTHRERPTMKIRHGGWATSRGGRANGS